MGKKQIIIFFTIMASMTIIFLIIYFFNNKSEKGCGDAGISREEFKSINIGDSQFKVDNIVDPNDKFFDDEIYATCVQKINQSSNNHIYSYTYKYIGEHGGYALITFTADYSSEDLFILPSETKKENVNIK